MVSQTFGASLEPAHATWLPQLSHNPSLSVLAANRRSARQEESASAKAMLRPWQLAVDAWSIHTVSIGHPFPTFHGQSISMQIWLGSINMYRSSQAILQPQEKRNAKKDAKKGWASSKFHGAARVLLFAGVGWSVCRVDGWVVWLAAGWLACSDGCMAAWLAWSLALAWLGWLRLRLSSTHRVAPSMHWKPYPLRGHMPIVVGQIWFGGTSTL